MSDRPAPYEAPSVEEIDTDSMPIITNPGNGISPINEV
jgi:hypothetical protein